MDNHDHHASARGEYLSEATRDKSPLSCFISYSRRNTPFVKTLKQTLEVNGRKVWVDLEEMPSSADYFIRVQQAIEECDTFLFVLSPDSIRSDLCGMEIDHAVKCAKQIMPVVAVDVDYREVRKEIADLNWFFFREDGDDFNHSVRLLLLALDQGKLHVRYHTKLLVRALYWEQRDFEKSVLLIGNDLKRAESWLKESAIGSEPRPTTLHLAYVTASRNLNRAMKTRRLIAVFFTILVAIGVLLPGWGVFVFSLVFGHIFTYFASVA